MIGWRDEDPVEAFDRNLAGDQSFRTLSAAPYAPSAALSDAIAAFDAVLLPVRDLGRVLPLHRRLDRRRPRDRPGRKDLIAQAAEQQAITPEMLTLHADRGQIQRSKPVAFFLADLGVTKTHSRPYTSSDNPYSESGFKTLKYRPEFPDRFGSLAHAREHCRAFVGWYNGAHRHSGIGLMTPTAVHHGHAARLHQQRAGVLDAAYAVHPERFVHRPAGPARAANRRLDQQTDPGPPLTTSPQKVSHRA